MCFLHNLQRPKWAASQVSLNFPTCGLSTAQWSVTTAVNMHAIPTSSTKMVILILVRLCMFPVGATSVLFSKNKKKSVRLNRHWSETLRLPPSVTVKSVREKKTLSFLSPIMFSLSLSQICATGSKGKGPDSSVLLSCPSFPTHWRAASSDSQLLRQIREVDDQTVCHGGERVCFSGCCML